MAVQPFLKDCKKAADRKHDWIDVPGRDKNGGIFTYSICRHCGQIANEK